METKKSYIIENEIKVKNLLADIFENESNLLAEIHKTKVRLEKLTGETNQLKKLRNDLVDKFNELNDSGPDDWGSKKAEFELALHNAEGDKESFIEKAESLLIIVNEKTLEIEEKLVNATEKSKDKFKVILDDLKQKQSDLQEKLDEAKTSSGEKWKEVKHWFLERSNNIRKYLQDII